MRTFWKNLEKTALLMMATVIFNEGFEQSFDKLCVNRHVSYSV